MFWSSQDSRADICHHHGLVAEDTVKVWAGPPPSGGFREGPSCIFQPLVTAVRPALVAAGPQLLLYHHMTVSSVPTVPASLLFL